MLTLRPIFPCLSLQPSAARFVCIGKSIVRKVLLRFLIARKCDVERALDMLHSVLEWRQENATSMLSSWGKSDQGKHEKFDLYWKPLGYAGLDHEGDPVFYERVGQNDLQGLLNCNQEFIREHSIYNAECVFASLELARRKNLKRPVGQAHKLVADHAACFYGGNSTHPKTSCNPCT